MDMIHDGENVKLAIFAADQVDGIIFMDLVSNGQLPYPNFDITITVHNKLVTIPDAITQDMLGDPDAIVEHLKTVFRGYALAARPD